jgi:hypothetical protein
MEERRGGGRSYGVLLLRGQGPEPPPIVEETVRLWLERPDRVREEVEGEHSRTHVRSGHKMWSRMPKWGAVEHDVDGEGDLGWQHGMLLTPLALAPRLSSKFASQTTVAGEQNAFLKTHSWEEYAASPRARPRRRRPTTRSSRVTSAVCTGWGWIACHYRAAEWRHKEIELPTHELLQYLDRKSA